MTLHRLTSGLARVVEIGVAAILALIVILAMGEIILRYVTGHSLVWVDELSRLLFVWLTFLAGAAAFHHRLHFRVVLLWRAMTSRTRQRLELVIDVLSAGFALVLFIESFHIIERTQVQRTTALQIPMSYLYVVVPLSALLIIVFIALRWAEAIRAKRFPADPAATAHA